VVHVIKWLQNTFVLADLLSSDGLIKDVLLENDLDFDLWDIDNLQPPEGSLEPQNLQQQWQVQNQPNIVEIKQAWSPSQTFLSFLYSTGIKQPFR
jgi:hypothetical protein